MRISDLMSHRPITIDAFDSIETAAQAMRANAVGALPVLEQQRLVGIVTDRDLVVRALAKGCVPWETYVREAMTHHPVTCAVDDAVTAAVERMMELRVRRLIVVDATGAVRGVLTVDDLLLCDETRVLGLNALRQAALVPGELDGPAQERGISCSR